VIKCVVSPSSRRIGITFNLYIRTGHPRLMMAVRKMGLRTGKEIKKGNLIIEYQVC